MSKKAKPLQAWAALQSSVEILSANALHLIGLIPLFVAAVFIGFPSPANAQITLTITVGSIELPANSTTATVPIYVDNTSGSDIAVGGLSLAIEVQSGGPKIALPANSHDNTYVDLLTGTTFASNNAGQVGDTTGNQTLYHQFWSVGYDTEQTPPTLSPGSNNLVATVKFDTTGVTPNVSYTLKLAGTFFGDTVYSDPGGFDIPMNINNGTLTVVPEPQQYALAIGVLLLGFAGFVRWKRAIA